MRRRSRAGHTSCSRGPPGTGKSTLLRSVASDFAVPYVLVEGNVELTPGRLLGQFDPAIVLTRGYVPDIPRYGHMTGLSG